MHQTRKGNQWYFEMKAHIGVDSKEGIVHSICSTAASVSDIHMLPELLHGEEKKVWGDAGYQGQTKAIHQAASLHNSAFFRASLAISSAFASIRWRPGQFPIPSDLRTVESSCFH